MCIIKSDIGHDRCAIPMGALMAISLFSPNKMRLNRSSNQGMPHQDQINRLFRPVLSRATASSHVWAKWCTRFRIKIALGVLILVICFFELSNPTTNPVVHEMVMNEPIEVEVSVSAHDRPLDGLYGLVERRAPMSDIHKIRFEILKDDDRDEWFTWKVLENSVLISGNSISSMSQGLGDFYRRYCSMELISWSDMSRPSEGCFSRTKVNGHHPSSHSASARFPLRYGWNAVTFSYTTTWWSWDRYEQELDWLALRGVNLLLAHEGQEYIMRKMFLEEGLGAEIVSRFFTHQTYFAWNRMGNIHQVGGPLDLAFIQMRFSLQHQIIHRMTQLGMSPVLPGFNGFVPQGTPGSKCHLKYWSGFDAGTSSVCRLDPKTPTFRRLASRMAELQLDAYGKLLDPRKTVYLSSDTYNENPVFADEDFAALANAIYDPPFQVVKRRGYSHLKLVMQMWFLANDWEFWTRETAMKLLESYPKDSLVLLDLHAEKRAQFERLDLDEQWFVKTQHSLVFCVLHSFGGGGGIAGEVESTYKKMVENPRVEKVLKASKGGIGFAPEALEQNAVVYDMALTSAWSPSKSFKDALTMWIDSRYRGRSLSLAVYAAWMKVMATAYSRPDYLAGFSPTKSVWEIRPFPEWIIRGRFQPTAIAYPFDTFADPVRKLRDAVHEIGRNNSHPPPSLIHDLIDFARQLASDVAMDIVRVLTKSNFNNNEETFGEAKAEMKVLLALVGELLSLHPSFCFLDQRPGYIALDTKTIILRRQLLTIWHETNDGSLADYASRQLGGSLFFQVHYKRWEVALESWDRRSNSDLQERFREIELAWTKQISASDQQNQCRPYKDPGEVIAVVDKILTFVSERRVVELDDDGEEEDGKEETFALSNDKDD